MTSIKVFVKRHVNCEFWS